AEDLRRYQTGQLVGAHRYSLRQLLSRWLRRHRAAVSVAVVATVVLLALGGLALFRIVAAQHVAEAQRALAEQQRDRADKSRGEAEDLLGFMLGDLRDKLQPLGRLDLLDVVAKKVAAHYANPRHLSDAELATRARAQRDLGDVLELQGHADDALAQYRAAL